MKSIVTLLLAVFALNGATAPNYHLTHRFVLGGDGGWDYLTYDPAGKRLFISRSTHVMVVDPATGAVVGDIANTPGVHGIALAPDLGKGFTSNGAGSSVTVFDLKSLKPIATIRIDGKNPDGIAYDTASKRVLTFNGGSNDATVIDAQNDSVAATIPLGGRPEFPVSDGKGTVYDNIESTSEIVAIDAGSAKIVHRWPLSTTSESAASTASDRHHLDRPILGNHPCQSPSGLSMDRTNRRLFTACDGQMGVVDADNGSVIATLPTGAGTDATRFDPQTKLAFASNGRDGTLTLVHEDSPTTFTVVQNAKTESGARTMALDPQTGTVFLVTAQRQPNPNATTQRDRYRVVPGTFALLEMEPSRAGHR